MKYSALIKVFEDVESLYKIVLPEISKGKRAELKVKKFKDHLLFEVKAKDSTALRTGLSSVSKLIQIYEKMKGV